MLIRWKYFILLAVPLVVAMAFPSIAQAKKPNLVTVPAGTPLTVRIDQSVSTRYNHAGDGFNAVVASPLVENGVVIIPRGTPVEGRVVSAHPSGRLRGVATGRLTLDKMMLTQGRSYDLPTNIVGRSSTGHKVRNWSWIGGGGGAGALIGALAAGGKGALIGGPVGAGAGLGVAALTGKKQVSVPAETALTFHLKEPLRLPANSGKHSNS